ncbi:MAG: bifunctional folylpolyglutamate synthase/dihydrofolate synthase [Chloroflexi bacterium]|nr:bifunctional folylpolyglutamate synthase/dihydrofolate synthase [Chloroflexota bacterium]MBU1746783.1 bifunctional folylpolyglutamate synthase/dihydrofolate synthase [Chloroflexota bacterium]
MTYADALRYLYSFTDYTKPPAIAYTAANYNLDRLRRLLDHLGRPQDGFRAVQAAGTKGKGSTAAMLAAMLQAAGRCAGLYTSPHLHTFRERIRIDGELVSEADFARLITRMVPAIDAIHHLPDLGRLTTFEIATALAFLHFAEARVDTAVLEAGIGGRLDATNVVDPVLSIITPISFDHMAILGNTLAAIAGEKAGIIKPGVPAVIAPQPAEARAVFERVAGERDAPLALVGRDWTWAVRESTPEGLRCDVVGPDRTYADLHVALIGGFQGINAATAVAAAAQLGLDEAAIRRGLADVWWPARLEILARRPWVVADSAHNGDSAQKLAAALVDVFQPQRIILVLGISRGHNLDDTLGPLLPLAAHVVATQPQHPRALPATELQDDLRARGCEAPAFATVPQALDHARSLAGPDDLICAVALFVAGEARAYFGAPGSDLRDPVSH